MTQPTTHGGKRAGAGRKPLANGKKRLLLWTTWHDELLQQYRQRNGLASASAAMRHLVESTQVRGN